jgi:hypothetical protein
MELNANVIYQPDRLTVNYGIRNDRDEEVYLPQFMPWRSGPTRGCYVYAHADGQLLLYFGTVRTPPGICLMRENRLYAERLLPGRTMNASVSIVIPILESGNEQPADASAPHEQVLISRLKMVVTYHRQERKLRIAEVPGIDLYDVRGTDPAVLVTEFTVPNPVVAQRRLAQDRPGDFDRPFERRVPQAKS